MSGGAKKKPIGMKPPTTSPPAGGVKKGAGNLSELSSLVITPTDPVSMMSTTNNGVDDTAGSPFKFDDLDPLALGSVGKQNN